MGYTVAIPLTLMVLRIAWRRWVPAFVALQVATLMVAASWFLRDRPVAGWANVGWAFGFACTWVAVGRVRARREGRR